MYWMKRANCGALYLCIEGVVTRDLPDTPELFALSGEALGVSRAGWGNLTRPCSTRPSQVPQYARPLSTADGRSGGGSGGRLRDVSSELAFARAREAETRLLLDEVDRGTLPIRVTHNDTKLNNVLLDRASGEGVCVIDLDTVMPGLVAYDFGDAIRTGASTAAEDEEDFRQGGHIPAYVRGFCPGVFEQAPGDPHPTGDRAIAHGRQDDDPENGLRFLADHLNGDLYFRVHRAGQ